MSHPDWQIMVNRNEALGKPGIGHWNTKTTKNVGESGRYTSTKDLIGLLRRKKNKIKRHEMKKKYCLYFVQTVL